MSTQNVVQAMEHYKQPKPNGDIDLIAEVRQRMIKAGLSHRIAHFDNHKFIQEANGKESSVQRYLLNRYWTSQLLHSSTVSIEERYCLIPDGMISDWLDLFQARVLPFVIANDLPCAA